MTVNSERPPFSCFVDRTHEPSRASVLRALVGGRVTWENLEAHLSSAYGLKGSFRFMYGPRYGWALRFERGGRLILAMYPNRGYLTLQVILGRSQVAGAMAAKLPPRVSRVLAVATDYPEGRWLFMPVRSARAGQEAKTLIALKMSRSNRPAAQAGQQRGRRTRG